MKTKNSNVHNFSKVMESNLRLPFKIFSTIKLEVIWFFKSPLYYLTCEKMLISFKLKNFVLWIKSTYSEKTTEFEKNHSPFVWTLLKRRLFEIFSFLHYTLTFKQNNAGEYALAREAKHCRFIKQNNRMIKRSQMA